MANFPDGVYTFEITASVGEGPAATAVITFFMTLINPCPSAALDLKSPISDFTAYFFTESQQFAYDVQAMATTGLDVSCGFRQIEFRDAESGGFIDTKLFDDGRFDWPMPSELRAPGSSIWVYLERAVSARF